MMDVVQKKSAGRMSQKTDLIIFSGNHGASGPIEISHNVLLLTVKAKKKEFASSSWP